MRFQFVMQLAFTVLMLQQSQGNRNRHSVSEGGRGESTRVEHVKDNRSESRVLKQKKVKKSPKQKSSKTPSSSPSVSLRPSYKPTSVPSNSPTISKMPSSFPSQSPSKIPSSTPSLTPTSSPSKEPTSFPSSNPTMVPSSSPSISHMPSSTPSLIPSRMPSSTPSSEPSSNPTSTPTSVPTSIPSLKPSNQPTTSPSSFPSLQPSSIPTSEPTASPSSSPSSDPSSSPTDQPTSIPSSIPTTEPSASPSSLPSSQPSLNPTSEPSAAPSSSPSSQPTLSPTGQPTNTPSSTPSANPSTSPSLSPSLQPSLAPSEQPSNVPSLTPSISTKPSYAPSSQPSSIPSTQSTTSPSLAPSISHPPTIKTISGLKQVFGENGEVGVQSGCPTHQNTNNVNYAEDSVTRYVVSFVYSITTDKSMNESSWDDLISTVEIYFNQKLFDEYINCTTVRRLSNRGKRYMADLDQVNTTANMSGSSLPIGVSSLPKDKKSDEIGACSGPNKTCAIDGAITFLFETAAGFSRLYQQGNALEFIKNNLIANIENINGISGIMYMGAMDDIPLNNVGVIIPRADLGEEIVDNETTVTSLGFITIGSAFAILVIAVALLTTKKRARTYQRHEEVLLSTHENSYSEEVMEVSAIQEGTQRLVSYTSRADQNIMDAFGKSDPNFHNISHDNEFKGPDNCGPLHDLIEIDESSQLNDFSTQYCTQVRRCVSATCEACKQNVTERAVRFVSIGAEADERLVSIEANEDGVEVLSGILRSPSSLSRCARSYEVSDTVEF